MKLFQETARPLFPADTFGWDTVYAIPFSKLNDAIYSRRTGPDQLFPMAFGGGADDPRVENGVFDAWEIVAGGSGEIINMCLPFSNMDFVRGGSTIHTGLVGEALIEVRLSALPSAANSEDGKRAVEFRLMGSAGQDPVITVTTMYTGATPPPLDETQINDAIRTWLNENCEQFNFVFATVNLSEKASQAGTEDTGFQWMLPTDTAYAVRDQGTTASGVFAILCMTQGRTPSPVRDVAISAIPTDTDEEATSGFLISERRFIENVLKPFMHETTKIEDASAELGYRDATPEDFEVTSDFKIRNRATMVIPNLVVKKDPDDEEETGQTTEAKIQTGKFSVGVDEHNVVMNMTQLHYPYPIFGIPGAVNIFVDYESRSSIARVEGDASTEARFFLNQTEVICPRANVEKSPALAWAEIGVPIAISVLTAAIGSYFSASTPALKITSQTGETAALGAFRVSGQLGQDATRRVTMELANGAVNALAKEGAEITISGLVGRMALTKIAAVAGAVWFGAATTMTILQKIQENGAAAAAPDLRNFLSPAMESIVWPGVSNFEVTSAQLNQSFQIGINTTFAPRP